MVSASTFFVLVALGLLTGAPLPWLGLVELALLHTGLTSAPPAWDRVQPSYFDTELRAVASSESGDFLAAIAADGRLCGWTPGQDSPRWCVTLPWAQGVEPPSPSLAASRDGRWLAVGIRGWAQLRDASSGALLSILPGAGSPWAFGPDGALAATRGRVVLVWRGPAWSSPSRAIAVPHTLEMLEWAAAEDALLLGWADEDMGFMGVLDLISGAIHPLSAGGSTALPGGPPRHAAIAASGLRAASAHLDQLYVWDLDKRERLAAVALGSGAAEIWVDEVAMSPDGSIAYASTSEEWVEVDAATGHITARHPWGPGRPALARTAALLPATDRAVLAGSFGGLHTSSLQSGKEVWRAPSFDPEVASAIALDDMRQRVWVGDDRGRIRAFAVGDASLVVEKAAHARGVQKLAMSPDGSRLATSGRDGKLAWRDPATGDVESAVSLGRVVSALTWTTNSSLLVTGAVDGNIRVFAKDAQKPSVEWSAHASDVTGVAASPDGQRIASCSEDRTVKLWETSTGALVAELTPGEANAAAWTAVAFSPTGQWLAASRAFAQGGGVVVWDAATRQLHASLASELGAGDVGWIGRQIIAWASLSGDVVAHDVQNASQKRLFGTDAGGYGLALSISADGSTAVVGTGGQERGIRIFTRRPPP